MKRALLLLLLAVMICPAHAEGFSWEYWTSKEDIFYHLDANCGNPDYPRVAVSAEAAEEFGRQPCPICLDAPEPVDPEATDEPAPVDEIAEPEPEGLRAIERGGTWVFRVPGETLRSMNLNGESISDAAWPLVALYGESLTDALDARLAVPADGSTPMSLRILDDGDACLVTRPKKSYKSKRPLEWQGVHVIADIFKPGEFTVEGASRVWEYVPRKERSVKKVFSETYHRRLEIEVYRGMDTYIAVLKWDKMTDKDQLTGLVTIGDLPGAIPVMGYIEKKSAVYCCVLTDEEVQALKDGAEPLITPRTAREAPEPDPSPTPEPDPAEVPDLSDDVAGEEPLF